jgi:AcrR family transcriptional regulator
MGKAGTSTITARRRREDPAIRRAQILEAARRCFAKLGFQATSVEKIAAEAGVSVGLLYRFFASKSAMIEAIVVEEVEDQLIQMSAGFQVDEAGAIRPTQWVEQNLRKATLDHDRLALMLEIVAEVSRNAELRSFIHSRSEQLRKAATLDLVEKGLDRCAALQMIDKIDLATAIASGVAVHAVYSGKSLEKSLDQAATLINATIFSSDR